MIVNEDRVFRTWAELRGAHYHVAVFSAPRPDRTFAKLGDLVMDERDYRAFTTKLRGEHRLRGEAAAP